MLGLDNPIHIAFILVLLLLVFGAKRLPEMGKSLGTGLRGFKESISGEHDPTAHLAATPAVTPMMAQPVTPEPVPAPVHPEQLTAAIAVAPVFTAEPVVTAEPVATAEPVLTTEPVAVPRPVGNRVPVWRV
jgi:sec-independent protein translocase protein TatA